MSRSGSAGERVLLLLVQSQLRHRVAAASDWPAKGGIAQSLCYGMGVLEWRVNHREEKCSECNRNDGIPDYREHEVRAG